MKRRDVEYLEAYFEKQATQNSEDFEDLARCMAIIRREKNILVKRAQRTREFFSRSPSVVS